MQQRKVVGCINWDRREQFARMFEALLAHHGGLELRLWPDTIDPSRLEEELHDEIILDKSLLETDLLLFSFPSPFYETIARYIRNIRQINASIPIINVVLGTLALGQIKDFRDLGVTEILSQPFRYQDIVSHIDRLTADFSGERKIAQNIKESIGLTQLIGESPCFLNQVKKIPALAHCNVKVLICGETGTGKELFARAIHYLSPRANNPFISINCGAIPTELIENELFGHAKGAYTGAQEMHIGLVGAAAGGTLFLDEIDSLPMAAQVKLLRFIQENEYRPLGTTGIRQADIRLVSATNADLGALVEKKEFRRDLYYRVNVATLELPPLRQRKADIRLLAEHFLDQFNRDFNKHIPGFSDGAMLKLLSHDWPGNIRELENQIERAVALTQFGNIEVDVLNIKEFNAESDGHDTFVQAKRRVIEEFEKNYLRTTLEMSEGNITRAARKAGKNRRAYWELLRKHSIVASEYQANK